MTAASSSVAERIAALQTRIKELKVAKQDATAEVDEMKALKEQLGKDKKSGSGFQLKTPKGTVDHRPEATLLRKKIFHTLESIFVKYGASTIDTPVFELREILAGKYGEDSKLIYDLQDQGGELCSLRYDLTVGRDFCCSLCAIRLMFRTGSFRSLPRHERNHLHEALSHRQGLPSRPARGHQGTDERVLPMRQCHWSSARKIWRDISCADATQDFDIAGVYDPMVPDAEVLSFLCDALTALDIGEFTVKMNHRKILDGIFELAGVPQDKTRSISSAVDKLDKVSD
jgi:histidyl-tRNA synthetase